jgi:hypothetical protein
MPYSGSPPAEKRAIRISLVCQLVHPAVAINHQAVLNSRQLLAQ